MTVYDIKDLLTQWGNWAHERIGTEYPGRAVGIQSADNKLPAVIKCCDKDGARIDRAVSSLKAFDSLAHDLILYHYVFKISENRLSKEIGKSRIYVSMIIKGAEYYIAGQLDQPMTEKVKAH